MQNKKQQKLRILIIVIGALFALCLALTAFSALKNRGLPQPDLSDQLSSLDKARLAEAIQLKATFGDELWSGFGGADIPIILSNDAYEFLFGLPVTPPVGWSAVPTDTFNAEAYFRRPADNPQNFAVQVGDSWVASMATKSRTDAFLIKTFKDMFPSPIKQIFPYFLLIQPSETQIGAVLHEQFHVFQIQNAPDKLKAAEAAHKLGEQYESVFEAFDPQWKEESGLLADALAAKTIQKKRELARQFLEMRDARRKTASLAPGLADYERWLEWEEGVAKYIEIASLKFASQSADYTPILTGDSDFKSYRAFNQRWSNEMFQLRNPTSGSESRFYMTGLAQAFLLDELMPGWKEKYWQDGVFLEDLLRMAVGE